MKRSRLGQIGSWGSKRRKCCHRQYATGARAIGVPGCPELAAWTASIDNVRIVLMHVASRAAQSCMIVLRIGGSLREEKRRLAGTFTAIRRAIAPGEPTPWPRCRRAGVIQSRSSVRPHHDRNRHQLVQRPQDVRRAWRVHANGEFWVELAIKLETSDIGSVLLT